MSEDNEPTVEDYIREMAGEEPKPKPEPKAEKQEAAATSTDGEDAEAEEEETPTDEDEASEEQEASDDDEESEDEEEEKPKRRRSRPDPKKRIRKLVAERNSERDENARLRAQIDVLMQQAQQAPKPAEQTSAQTQDDPQPQQDQYDDYAKYLEDRSSWASRQAVKQALAEAGKEAAQAQKQQTAQAREAEVVTQAKALFAKGVEEFEDFEEVAADPSLTVTEAMTSALLASDIGHQVQYHLGNNPEEAARISKLDPVQQVREMALLEASLKAPKAKPRKKTTNAPEPIKPVGGKSAPKSIDEDTMDIGDYMRKYNAGELPSQRPR
jgi:hypothetical protein